MPISDPPSDLCNIRLWLYSLKDAVNGSTFDFTSQDAYKVFGVASSAAVPSFILLDAAHIQTGVLDNARVNWGAPSVIGSTTPNNAFFNNSVVNSYAATTNTAPNINLRKFHGADFITVSGVSINHDLGNIFFSGTADSSTLTSAALIRATTTEAWTNTTTGASLLFSTTPTGDTGYETAMTIYAQKGLNIVKRADGIPSGTTGGDLFFQNNSMWSRNTNTTIRQKGLMYNSLNDMTVTNTVTATSIVDTSGFYYSNMTFVANYLVESQVLRLKAGGYYTATHTDRTITIQIRYGGTTLVSAPVTLTSAAGTDNSWYIEAVFILRTTGASGSIKGAGILSYTNAGTITSLERALKCDTTINTTTSNTMDVRVVWNAASTNNSITCTTMVWDWE
jgi:hypothetical protein